MPHVKLDVGLIDSTLWADDALTRVFIAALCKAEPWDTADPVPALVLDGFEPSGFIVPPGWYGLARCAGVGLIGAARIDEARGMLALKRLGEPDPGSRSPQFDGRRLVRIGGGFVVLNFYLYRDRDYSTAARSRRYRERQRTKTKTAPPKPETPDPGRGDELSRRDVTPSRRDITQAEAEAEAKEQKTRTASFHSAVRLVDESTSHDPATVNGHESGADPGLFGNQPPPKRAACPFDAIVALYHEILPNNPRCLKLTTARRGAIRARWVEDLTDLDDWEQFFRDVAADRFYTGGGGRGWFATLHWLTKADNFAKVVERHRMPRNRRR